MLFILGLILAFLLGIEFIHILSIKSSFLEKIAFAFPFGFGIISGLMFILDIFRIPLNNQWLLLGIIIFIILIQLFFISKYRRNFSARRIIDFKKIQFKKIQITWLFFVSIIFLILVDVFIQGVFWPVLNQDSISGGYDFIGKAISFEGTIDNSIFVQNNGLTSVRSLYPPLTPYSLAYMYILGLKNTKIVGVLFFISTILVFYTFLRKEVHRLNAIFFTLMLLLVPQYLLFGTISSSNITCVFYVVAGFLSIYYWFDKKDNTYFVIGVISFVFAVWTRTDAIVLAVGSGVFVLFDALRTRKLVRLSFFCLSIILIFFIWQFYLDIVLEHKSIQPIITTFFWDPVKVNIMIRKISFVTFNLDFFGLTMHLFFLAFVLNIYNTIRYKNKLVYLIGLFVSWMLYILLYYQIDSDFSTNTLGGWITSGYKRGLFYFIPLALFFTSTNKLSIWVFSKLSE